MSTLQYFLLKIELIEVTSSLPCSGYEISYSLPELDGKPSCPDCCYRQDTTVAWYIKRVL